MLSDDILNEKNRYTQIIERIFLLKYSQGMAKIPFDRDEIIQTAEELGMDLPKNLGDVIYSFRYRTELPETIKDRAEAGYEWIIRPAGKGRYRFVLTKAAKFVPNPMSVKTKIPDATRGWASNCCPIF